MRLSRAETGACVALVMFSFFYIMQIPDALSQHLLELLAPVVILSVAWVLTLSVPATDRISMLAIVATAASVALHQAIGSLHGLPAPGMAEILGTVCRQGTGLAMIVLAAVVSTSRPAGQYAYNVIFVGAVAAMAGAFLDNLVSGAPAMTGGGLLAFLQGGATGSAFSLATIEARAVKAPATEEKE